MPRARSASASADPPDRQLTDLADTLSGRLSHPPADPLSDVPADHHAAMHAGFRWQVPPAFNIGEVCCGRWARETPDAVAIVHETEAGTITRITYATLQRDANRLSHLLRGLGVERGDRVAVVLPQRPETAVAHIALYQLGAVAMPLTMLFGPEALQYRLQHSEAAFAIVDESAIANLRAARSQCPLLRTVVAVGGAEGQGDLDWKAGLAAQAEAFDPVTTDADDAAVLIYTSGTTGPPKGALIPHRALLGNLSGFVCSQNWFGFADSRLQSAAADRHIDPRPTVPAASAKEREVEGVSGGPRLERQVIFWSPADWAWTGGLMDALLPTLYFGGEIVAYQGRFTPDKACALMERHRVTHSFLFPTALKAMMKAVPAPRERYRLRLQAIMSAGEAVGDAVFAYCEQQLGVTVNEMFGQTEINYIVGNCAMNGRPEQGIGWPARPGSMGKPYPGHRIAVIDDHGRECPRGTPGDVALHRRDVHGHPDPIFFLGYWKNDAATRAKFTRDRLSAGRPQKGGSAGPRQGSSRPPAVSTACDALGVPWDSWCRTGDTAVMDADGYLWYQGRSDDVFKAAGYRIGPSEIENCLVKHPAVANAAVVPKPDASRGALVKAYVVLADGHAASPELIEELQAHVRGRLAPYEYPKEIEFIEALPMTTTGKVQRRVLRLQEEARAAAAAGVASKLVE